MISFCHRHDPHYFNGSPFISSWTPRHKKCQIILYFYLCINMNLFLYIFTFFIFIYLYIFFINLCTFLSIQINFNRCISLSIDKSFYLKIYLFYLQIYLCLQIYLSINQSSNLSINKSVYPSVIPSIKIYNLNLKFVCPKFQPMLDLKCCVGYSSSN